MPNENEKFYNAGRKQKVLIVEDEPINRELLGAFLGDSYDLIFAENGREAEERIRENGDALSLVLLDLIMPEIGGLEVLRWIRSQPETKRLPVIVLTSDQKSEADSLSLGANDFIPKPYPQPDVILARVRRTIELAEDRVIISETERDPLTGLYNPEYFFRYAAKFDELNPNVPMDAVAIDISHFHIINDRFGKAYGDAVLKKIGAGLRKSVGDSGGIICRRGSDTFLIYLPHSDDPAAILRRVFEELETKDNIHIRMGVYLNADKKLDIERRFDRAKAAADLHRDRISDPIGYYDDSLHEKELFEEQLTDEFSAAVEGKQFLVFYQPKYAIRKNRPVLAGAEALVRWSHPKRGMISPGIFIPLFEKNGLIGRLDEYVWNETAARIAEWKKVIGYTVPVSVNVSRIDFYDPELTGTLTGIIGGHGLDKGEMHLEITESAYMGNSGQIVETLRGLRNNGFQIEMDDFGSGYSSLNVISSLPIDVLKIDMAFIRSAFREKKDLRLLEIIIDIAGYLAVPTVAEGVETEEQYLALKEIGCDVIQGYYFSKPLPAEEFGQLLRKEKEAGNLPTA